MSKKVYVVITEVDGETHKEPGRTTTDIHQNQYRFAANSIRKVLQAAERMLGHSEEEIVTIHEEHPAIIVLDD